MYVDNYFMNLVHPYWWKFKKSVFISQKNIDLIKAFIPIIIEYKHAEKNYQIDYNKLYKRWYTALLGELAVEKLFNIHVVNWNINPSIEHDHADLLKAGYNIGVKTVSYGKCHIIHSKPVRPEIMLFKMSHNLLSVRLAPLKYIASPYNLKSSMLVTPL